jgi:threonyl-tRNA synthetase
METLKMSDFRIRVGTKDDSDKYIGEDKNWEHATNEIKRVLDEMKIPYTVEIGDAAFYGPKADIVIHDAIGREWQIGTIQVDYNLPEKFDISYVGEDNTKHRPVMIHRAPFGSFERFTGILIEHFGGAFPTWLSPKQVVIVPISEKFESYAKELHNELIDNDVRCELDDSNASLGARIRNARKLKVPYTIVIGEKEVSDNTVTIRNREGKQDVVKKDKFVEDLVKEIKERK